MQQKTLLFIINKSIYIKKKNSLHYFIRLGTVYFKRIVRETW